MPGANDLPTDLGPYTRHIRFTPAQRASGGDAGSTGTDREFPRGTRACIVPPVGASALRARAALVDGFEVDAYHLTRITTDGGEAADPARVFPVFEWSQPPGDLRVVSCALFGCGPEVRDGRIVNYGQCVIARRISEPPETVVDLAGLTAPCEDDYANRFPRVTETGDEIACDTAFAADDPPRHVTTLLVGCWAYDDAGVVAATYLERVAPGEFPGADDFVVAACGTEEVGKSCLLDEGEGFGTCVCDGTDGTCDCAYRCLRDADCQPELPTASAATAPDVVSDTAADVGATDAAMAPDSDVADAAPSLVCAPNAAAYVRHCRSASEPAGSDGEDPTP